MSELIKLKVDEYNILALEKEYLNEFDEQVYSVFEDTTISLPNRDITIPRSTITMHTKIEDIIYHNLMQQRTILPHEASSIYYQVLKKMKVPYFRRLVLYVYSLRNCW